MELKNEFRVSVPIDVAWAVLTDLERVAPCMPGAQLQEVEGDEYRGIVKVKVGPISAQYKGTARFVEQDDAAHRAVLRAEGRDSGGQGNASAMVIATARSDGDGTVVSIDTDLSITGKVAQFGRSVMSDVSTKMLGEFADRLEADVLAGATAPTASQEPDTPSEAEASEASEASEPEASEPEAAEPEAAEPEAAEPEAAEAEASPVTSAVRTIDSAPAQPVDLLGTAGPSVLKRVLPLVAVLGLLVVLWRRRRS